MTYFFYQKLILKIKEKNYQTQPYSSQNKNKHDVTNKVEVFYDVKNKKLLIFLKKKVSFDESSYL